MRPLLLPWPLLLLLCGCHARKENDERVAADREDVKHALYRQFDEVLARYQADLEELANRIAQRIVRIEPDADVDTLVRRLEQMR